MEEEWNLYIQLKERQYEDERAERRKITEDETDEEFEEIWIDCTVDIGSIELIEDKHEEDLEEIDLDESVDDLYEFAAQSESEEEVVFYLSEQESGDEEWPEFIYLPHKREKEIPKREEDSGKRIWKTPFKRICKVDHAEEVQGHQSLWL